MRLSYFGTKENKPSASRWILRKDTIRMVVAPPRVLKQSNKAITFLSQWLTEENKPRVRRWILRTNTTKMAVAFQGRTYGTGNSLSRVPRVFTRVFVEIITRTCIWNILNLTLMNKPNWNFNQNSYIFIQENAFESVVSEMVAILSRP